MIRISLTSILLLLFIKANSQPVSKTMLRLPDTGQTTSFTSTYGEDSDFMINMPGFVDNADGTLTDTVTSLMWQKADGPEMTFSNAAYYCDTLTIAGHSDWRLPTAKEIYSILNHQRSNPALDITVFSPTTAEYWWSSDRQFNDTSKIWCANSGGGIGNHRMSETISAGGTKRFQVRAVRETNVPVAIAVRYHDLSNGTVLDSLSGLQWMKAPSTDSITWEQALTFADTLSLAGFTDWRLPNVKEIESLNNEMNANPSLPTNYFLVTTADKYWSSTSLPNQTSKAWYLDTRFGITTYDEKVLRHHVFCVRNYDVLPTSVNPIQEAPIDWIFYPNPFSVNLDVKGSNDHLLFDVMDTQGRTLLNRIPAREIPSRLDAGSYLVRRSDGAGRTLRLIKTD